MRYLTILAMLLFLVPGGAFAEDEGGDGGAQPPGPRPGGQPGRGGRGGGRMLKRIKAMDTDGDGKITREEYEGPERFFDRLDADGDGAISTEELDKMSSRRNRGGSGGAGQSGRGGGLTPQALDADKDNKVSKKELDAWFEKADQNGDGYVDGAEWTAATTGRRLRDPAPAVGADAPKVKAKSLKTKQDVDLSAVKRVTVLIFGSHT